MIVLLVAAGCTDVSAFDAPCTATELRVTPADGAEAVPADSTVVVVVEGEAPGFELWIDGGLLPEWTAFEGGRAEIVPDAPLVPEATYTVHGRVCDAAPTSRFTVAAEPIDFSAAGLWLLDLGDPALQMTGFDEAGSHLGDTATLQLIFGTVMGFLVQVAPADAEAVRVTMGLAAHPDDFENDEVIQWPEAGTLDWGSTSFATNPLVATDSRMLTLEGTPGTLRVDATSISGRITEAGPLVDARLRASLVADDLRELLFGLDVCTLLAASDLVCAPCPDAELGQCLTFELHHAAAPRRDDIAYDPDYRPEPP